MYPSISPYPYAGNAFTAANDPDGRKVVFVNGEVGSHASERASQSYWSTAFVNIVKYRLDDKNVSFVDGDQGMTAPDRYKAGYTYAVQHYTEVLNSLQKDDNGKIVEQINFVSHIKGAAYASGMAAAFTDLRNSAEYKDKFAGDGGTVGINLMLAPHQSFAAKAGGWNLATGATNIAISHLNDWLSGFAGNSYLQGDALNVRTDNGASIYSGVGKAHSVDGFHQEADRALMQYNINKAFGYDKGSKKYDGYSNMIDQGDEGNSTFNRKTGSYEE